MRASLTITSLIAASISVGCAVPAPTIHVRALGPADLDRFRVEEKAAAHLVHEEKAAARVYREHGCGTLYANLTAKYAVEVHIPAQVIAALVVVESSCRPRVVSPEHAVGLTQVIHKWHPEFKRDRLYDPDYNLWAGTRILRENVRLYGLYDGLANYNAGPMKFEYADRILMIASH